MNRTDEANSMESRADEIRAKNTPNLAKEN